MTDKDHKFKYQGHRIRNDVYNQRSNISFDKSSVCRICLEANNFDNPFVDICKCSKTMPMHLSCVREWMKRKCEVVKNQNIIFFNLCDVFCEVCQTEYPGQVKIRNKNHMLFEPTVDYSRKHVSFNIVDKKTFEIKGYTILYFEGTNVKFSIGRNQSNDISFDEASISRKHAEFRISKEGLRVIDMNSKFGTLLKRNIFVFDRSKLMVNVQIDKFLFEFHPFTGNNCFCNIYEELTLKVEPYVENAFRNVPSGQRLPILENPSLILLENPFSKIKQADFDSLSSLKKNISNLHRIKILDNNDDIYNLEPIKTEENYATKNQKTENEEPENLSAKNQMQNFANPPLNFNKIDVFKKNESNPNISHQICEDKKTPPDKTQSKNDQMKKDRKDINEQNISFFNKQPIDNSLVSCRKNSQFDSFMFIDYSLPFEYQFD